MTPHLPLRALLICCLATLLWAGAAAAQGLPPTVEADRQLQLASSEMDKADKADWAKVASALQAAEATGVRMPANFDYHYGRALHAMGQHTPALERLQRYLSVQGSKGKYYGEALQQFTSAQAAQTQAKAAAEKQAKVDAAWFWVRSTWRETDNTSGECGDARRRVRGQASNARAIECDCDVQEIDHPAYRGRYWTVCKLRWQANALLDGKKWIEDREYSQKERLESRNE